MATYDLTQSIPSRIQVGDILNCSYSGTYKQITLPIGKYKLEVWGASGFGSGYAKGGYSSGIISINKKTLFYIVAGGGGTGNDRLEGGYNGGGNGTSGSSWGCGGGGGSDVRVLQNTYNNRIIVAGGGGGGCDSAPVGGGISGGTPSGSARPGSQTGCGSSTNPGGFGYGGNATGSNEGGGGGGWYGGSGSYTGAWSGGGGSGYVYTSDTAANHPYNLSLGSEYYLETASTVAGNTSFTSPTGSSETGHSGDGYARITVIECDSKVYDEPEPRVEIIIPQHYTEYINADDSRRLGLIWESKIRKWDRLKTQLKEKYVTKKSIFTFTIDGNEYFSNDDMSFGEWVKSPFNTYGFYINEDDNYTICLDADDNCVVKTVDGEYVYLIKDTIIENKNYSTMFNNISWYANIYQIDGGYEMSIDIKSDDAAVKSYLLDETAPWRTETFR